MKKIVIVVMALFILVLPVLARDANKKINDIEFTKGSQTLGDARTFGVAIADVDMDGDNDVFMSNYIAPSRLWLNRGDGTFTSSDQDFDIGEVHDAAMADLNGDSYPDIVLISHAGPNRIYFNDGKANFKVSDHGFGKAGDQYLWVTLVDADRDGDIDAFIYSISSCSRLLLNDGRGVFRMTAEEYGGSHAKGYELADLNGDSFPDLILIMRQKPNQIWMNNSAGTFIDSGKTVGIGGNDIECQDCNGDGKMDIVIADSPGNTRIWLNESNTGTFKGGYTINEGALKCKLLDVDRDGDFDLITADPENGNKLWLNDGRGNFNYSGQVFGTNRVLRIAGDDLDGDGDPDVVLGQIERTGGNAIYFNESTVKKQKKLSAKK